MMWGLEDGDVYMLSEKAVGTDWRKKIVPTLRHAVGGEKFTKICISEVQNFSTFYDCKISNSFYIQVFSLNYFSAYIEKRHFKNLAKMKRRTETEIKEMKIQNQSSAVKGRIRTVGRIE